MAQPMPRLAPVIRATFPAKGFSDDIARLLRRPSSAISHLTTGVPAAREERLVLRSPSFAKELAKGTRKGKTLAPLVRFPYNFEAFLYPRSLQAWRPENSALAWNEK
jgi:hypothetical protein